MTAALVLGGVGLASALLLSLARRLLATREAENSEVIVAAVDALLPQSQCAQCGYPGCRPYAQAVAAGERLDLCLPGGQATVRSLEELLGRAGENAQLPEPLPQVARILAQKCVGCALCIEACPVDAIAGAPRYLHAVVEADCTGCELCVPVCPVDCIELVETSAAASRTATAGTAARRATSA